MHRLHTDKLIFHTLKFQSFHVSRLTFLFISSFTWSTRCTTNHPTSPDSITQISMKHGKISRFGAKPQWIAKYIWFPLGVFLVYLQPKRRLLAFEIQISNRKTTAREALGNASHISISQKRWNLNGSLGKKWPLCHLSLRFPLLFDCHHNFVDFQCLYATLDKSKKGVKSAKNPILLAVGESKSDLNLCPNN